MKDSNLCSVFRALTIYSIIANSLHANNIYVTFLYICKNKKT